MAGFGNPGIKESRTMAQYLVEKAIPTSPLPRVALFEAATPYPSFVSYGTDWLVIPADSPDEAAAYAEDYFAGELPDQEAAEEAAAAMRTIALTEGFEFAKILLLGG
jgi:hypothetical protein